MRANVDLSWLFRWLKTPGQQGLEVIPLVQPVCEMGVTFPLPFTLVNLNAAALSAGANIYTLCAMTEFEHGVILQVSAEISAALAASIYMTQTAPPGAHFVYNAAAATRHVFTDRIYIPPGFTVSLNIAAAAGTETVNLASMIHKAPSNQPLVGVL